MTELKDLERELERFNTRLITAALFVLLCFGLLVSRLVWLQVFRHEELALQAEANRVAVVPVVPNRGSGHQLLGLHAGAHAGQSDR